MTLPPEDPDSFTRHNSAPLVPQDYISVLTKVIEEATRDPVQLRNLVYALASNFLKPERKTTNPSSDTWQQAAAMFQLEHARRELERAIEAIEKDAAYRTQASRGAGHDVNPPPSQELPSANPLQSLHDQLREVEANPSEEASPPAHPAVSGDNAVIILPERAPSWLVQNSTNRLSPHYGQPWDQRFQSTLDAHVYAPAQRRVQIGLLPFVQLVAAAFIGVVIYVGVAGWIQTQQKATPPAIATPIALPVETVRAPDLVEAKIGAPKINVSLPFPVPRSYGVYAAGDGQLVELSQLPIRVPDSRVLLSPEIARPSHSTLPTGDLSFVVFRRDLVNSAPQTVQVRVIAQVSRVVKFINGKPSVSRVEGTWRMRSKAYDLKVMPLEGRPEMILLQPGSGFVFPPGRYALVLNGLGFDFSVAGTIVSPEQCLEQTEVVNGTILNDCPKT